MESKLRLSCVTFCLMLATSALAVVGCGDDSSKPNAGASSGGDTSAEGGADGSGRSGAGSSTEEGGGGSDSDSGRGGRAGNTGTGARPNIDPGGPDQPGPGPDGAGGAPDGGEDSLELDGVDLSDVSTEAPTGCVGGFDPDAGTLSITIDEVAPVVRLAVHAGVVQANGVDCQSESGDPAKADQVLSLSVNGGKDAEVLYLDFSDESFSGCLTDEGGISIDLGAGNDRLSVLGTLEADVIHAGTDAGKLVIDVDADDRADVTVEGAPEIVISTGAKGDEVRADGAALGLDPVELSLAIYGGGSGDALVGGSAADRLFGGIGNDWFDAGVGPAGADMIDGGEGNDTIDFSARSKALTITLFGGADDGEAGENMDISSNVEQVFGGQKLNTITGGPGDDTIYGGPENDVLDGGEGNDFLVGSEGDDSLVGGAGADTLYGEAGDDDLDGGPGDDLLSDTEGKNHFNAGLGDGDICVPTMSDKASGCEL